MKLKKTVNVNILPLPIFLAAFASTVVILDQLSKHFVVTSSLPVIQNSGGTFGILGNNNSLFAFISLLIICGVIWFVLKQGRASVASRILLALILGGGISNIIDRLRLGYVIDFIQVPFWPAFNVADACISIGVVGTLLFVILAPKPTQDQPLQKVRVPAKPE